MADIDTNITPQYNDDDIRTLNSLEHIQARPGMYIGRLGKGDHPDDGIYVLLKEVIDNSVDEFTVNAGRKIEITVGEDGTARVRDYGRGIPLDSVVACVSKINTGGKFTTGKDGKAAPFACSIGLNGVGLKAVNALSEYFTVISRRDGKSMTAIFENGVLKKQQKGSTTEPNGTEITFKPSQKFFPEFHFDVKHILPKRISNYAWLNSGLTLYLNGEKYYSRKGLLDLLDSKIEDIDTLYEAVHYRSDRLEFAFTHIASFDESYYSFVNGQYTNDGGAHLSSFKEGLLKAVNELAPKKQEPSNVRDGIVAVVAVRIPDPLFESQTKNKLGNSNIKGWMVNEVAQAILDVMYKNPELRQKLLDKIAQNEAVRTKVQAVRKEAKENAKKTVLRIPKLRDCQFHLCDAEGRRRLQDREKCHNSVIFLTEGDSAAANMVHARNPETQAVFPLRGKPLNCFGKGKDTIYKNEELFFIVKALGIENGLDELRYSKVIIASDADVDGFHIRLLVITFFLTLFQPLVLSNHLFILETPLYRVRNKKKTMYCYNDTERDTAIAALGKTCEMTRFKGLGEISPNEFKPFIREDMKLLPVTVDNLRDIDSILGFYMGANTPTRRDYIMDNLLDVEI